LFLLLIGKQEQELTEYQDIQQTHHNKENVKI